MIEEVTLTNIMNTGYFQKIVRQSLEHGKATKETEEAIFQRNLEDERKRIQPIYNSKGKVIGYNEDGKYVNVSA